MNTLKQDLPGDDSEHDDTLKIVRSLHDALEADADQTGYQGLIAAGSSDASLDEFVRRAKNAQFRFHQQLVDAALPETMDVLKAVIGSDAGVAILGWLNDNDFNLERKFDEIILEIDAHEEFPVDQRESAIRYLGAILDEAIE